MEGMEPYTASPAWSLNMALQLLSEDTQPIRCCPSLKHLTIEHTYLNPLTIALLTTCFEIRTGQRFLVSLKSCRYTRAPYPEEGLKIEVNFPLLEGREMDLVELGDLIARVDKLADDE